MSPRFFVKPDPRSFQTELTKAWHSFLKTEMFRMVPNKTKIFRMVSMETDVVLVAVTRLPCLLSATSLVNVNVLLMLSTSEIPELVNSALPITGLRMAGQFSSSGLEVGQRVFSRLFDLYLSRGFSKDLLISISSANS